MPGKNTGDSAKKKPVKGINAAEIKRIWSQLSIQEWSDVMRTTQGGNWSSHGRQLQGKCPFHDDSSPSFVINLEKHYAKCFNPDCGVFFWDPVLFYQELQPGGLTYLGALAELKDRFHIQLTKVVIKAIGKHHEHREMKRLLYKLLNGELVDVAGQAASPDLAYAQNTLRYLKMRGIDDMYHTLPIGVLPPERRLHDLVDEYAVREKVDNPWKKVKEYLEQIFVDAKWIGSVVFFTGASPNDPCRLKIRRVPQFSQGGFVASDGKDVCFIKDEQETRNGVFGLFGSGPYQPMFGSKSISSFVFVEGEFDALSVMAQQFKTGNIGFFCFAGGGGSVDSLDVMSSFGFTTAYVVGDHDKGGEGFAKVLLENTVRVAIRVFQWPAQLISPTHPNLDPDEAIKLHGLDAVESIFRNPDNYQLPYQWALQRAGTAMSEIDSDDVRMLTSRAGEWGCYVRDPAERETYVEQLASTYNLSAGLIRQEMMAGDDNEEAFIERVYHILKSRVHLLYGLREGNSHLLRVYDRDRDDIYDLPINEPGRIVAAIELMMRKDVYQFIREDVGEPGFLTPYDEMVANDKIFYLDFSNKLAGYLSKAVTRLSADLPKHSDIRYMNAGLHCVASTDAGSLGDIVVLYVVNGMQFYKGVFENGRLTFTKCEGPGDGNNVVFADKNDRPPIIFPQIACADDLNRDPGYTLAQMYEHVLRMVRIGWDFKHHHLTAELVAALTLQMCIADTLPRQPVVMFTSEPSGGKSSFIGGFWGRLNNPRINVLQQSNFMDNYTAAGVRQVMNHSTLCQCLDEFEDKGGNDRKSQAVRGTLLTVRGLANEEGTAVLGTASGRHQSFKIRCPVVTAAIRHLEQPEDISRFIRIEMDRKLDRSTPESVLLEAFGAQEIRRIREAMPLVMFRNVMKIRQAWREIADQYQDGGGLAYGKISRNREHYYGALAIMKAADCDYNRFIHDYFQANRSNLESIAEASLSSDLLGEVLSTPEIYLPDLEDRRPRTVNAVLSGDAPDGLNYSNSGCYYDGESKWLVVDWGLARKTVLKGTLYALRSPKWLKSQALRSAYHVQDASVLRDGVFDRLTKFIGRASHMSQISVFRVTNFIADSSAARSKGRVRGIEDLDLSEDYATELESVNFPTPEKKEAQGGTSESSTKPSPSGSKKINDDFNY